MQNREAGHAVDGLRRVIGCESRPARRKSEPAGDAETRGRSLVMEAIRGKAGKRGRKGRNGR